MDLFLGKNNFMAGYRALEMQPAQLLLQLFHKAIGPRHAYVI
jgi:hypothetical protein